MAVTPLPPLDRTASTFKTDTDTFFASLLPAFSVEVNNVAQLADASAQIAVSAKDTAVSAKDTAVSAKNTAVTASDAAVAARNDAVPAAQTATTKAGEASSSAQTALLQANRAQQAADSISSGPVTSVNGKTGVVTITKAELSLGSVNNTADTDKPVSNPQLAAMHALALSF